MIPAELIEKLGGTCEVARLSGIRPPSVTAWKASGVIPDGHLIRLAVIAEQRGIATRKEISPETAQQIWPELATPTEPRKAA